VRTTIAAVNSSSMEIGNHVTGERIVFRRTATETNGELLEFDDLWTRPDHRGAEHVHPEIEERWEVISGVAPAGSPRMSWNIGEGPAHLRVRMAPALRWEEFTRRLFAAAHDGRTDDRGTPEPLLLATLLREFHRELAPPS